MAPGSFVELKIAFIPAVAVRLEEATKGLGWSISHIVNDSLIKTLGLEGLGLSEDRVWGLQKKEKK
jgi:hypothetical protein